MKMNQVTITDIAYRAGVSEATVSRALNNNSQVSKETRSKILSIADELKYTVNKHASALRRTRSQQVMLVQMTENGVAPADNIKYFSWLNHYLFQAGYTLLLTQIDTHETFTSIPEKLNVDGIIVLSAPPFKCHPRLSALLEAEIPLVSIGRQPLIRQDVVSIQSGEFEAAYQLTNVLLEKGYRRILFIGESGFSSGERYHGYLQCLIDNHIQPMSYAHSASGSAGNCGLENFPQSIASAQALVLASNRIMKTLVSVYGTDVCRIPTVSFQEDTQQHDVYHLAIAAHNTAEMCRVTIDLLLQILMNQRFIFTAKIPMIFSERSQPGFPMANCIAINAAYSDVAGASGVGWII